MVFATASLSLDKEVGQSVNTAKRSVSGVASVERVSRTGHLFRVKGMDVAEYNEQNPVVLVCHRHASDGLMPGAVATIDKVTKRAGVLAFKQMVFDDDPISEAWWQKVSKGIVRMTSVGAFPIEWELNEEVVEKGKDQRTVRFIDITVSELSEISITPVGANQGAYLGNQVRGNQAIAAQLEKLEAQMKELDVIVRQTEISTESWGDASWPDACFVAETDAPKKDGRTVHAYRHLPHHNKTAKSATEHGTVDLPHLRNALARMNQVQPKAESAASYRLRAGSHLNAHARVLLKSRKEDVAALEDVLRQQPADKEAIERVLVDAGAIAKLSKLQQVS